MNESLIIQYSAAVLVAAGWRQVTIEARAVRVSPGMAQVSEVLTIDGETPAYGMTRTGAKRQEYDGRRVARGEVGKRKRLSACTVSS